MRIYFDVTREDVSGGLRNSSLCCPVALALRRKFPRGRVVIANYDSARVYIEAGKCLFGRLDQATQTRIQRYDLFGVMEPFRSYVTFPTDWKWR